MLVGGLLGLLLVDRPGCGRRPLLLAGAAVMSASLAVAAVHVGPTSNSARAGTRPRCPRRKHGGDAPAASGWAVPEGTAPVLAPLLVYAFAFASTWGPVAYVAACEMFPTRVRSTAASLAVALNFAGGLLVVSTFLGLCDALGVAAVLRGYAFVCALAFCFVLVAVPETRSKSLERVQSLYDTRTLPLPRRSP
jgi:MFS family permease